MGLRPHPLKVQRFFLWRRPIDSFALSLAIAALPFARTLSTVVFATFFAIGLYLIVFRHRSARRIDPLYFRASALLAAVAVALGLLHGNVAEDMRWISYPVYFLFAVALFPGWVLVRDPLRQIVLGARAAVILAIAAAAIEYVWTGTRIGFGTNAANTAFTVALLGIVARLSVGSAPSFLPNGRWWFYASALPVALTGTRTLLTVYVIVAIFDVLESLRAGIGPRTRRGALAAALVAGIGISAMITDGSNVVIDRVEETAADIETMATTGRFGSVGMSHRIALWQGAWQVIGDDWIAGDGGENTMRRIKAMFPGQPILERYSHVHNAVLDELRIRGVIGLVAHIGFFIAIFGQLLRHAPPDLRSVTVMLLLLFAVYGSLHGLLMSDANVALMAIVLVSLTDRLRKTGAIVSGIPYAVNLKPMHLPVSVPREGGLGIGR